MTAPTVQTCLWFDDAALDAAETYVRLLPGSSIRHVFPQHGRPDRAFMVQLDLLGQRFSFLNGGPQYRLTPAASIEVHLETQGEVDALWDALLQGGSASRCGWLTDRFGVSWQILPRALPELLASGNEAARARVLQAMMTMVKLDGPALRAAARG